jgi:hypothetical protein
MKGLRYLVYRFSKACAHVQVTWKCESWQLCNLGRHAVCRRVNPAESVLLRLMDNKLKCSLSLLGMSLTDGLTLLPLPPSCSSSNRRCFQGSGSRSREAWLSPPLSSAPSRRAEQWALSQRYSTTAPKNTSCLVLVFFVPGHRDCFPSFLWCADFLCVHITLLCFASAALCSPCGVEAPGGRSVCRHLPLNP